MPTLDKPTLKQFAVMTILSQNGPLTGATLAQKVTRTGFHTTYYAAFAALAHFRRRQLIQKYGQGRGCTFTLTPAGWRWVARHLKALDRLVSLPHSPHAGH